MKSKLGVQRQALETLRTAVDSCEHPVFPCALIAGDVVILELLAKLDYLKTRKVAVAFVDTFHLFPETITFLKQLEVHCVVALLPAFSSQWSGQHLHNRTTKTLSKRHVIAWRLAPVQSDHRTVHPRRISCCHKLHSAEREAVLTLHLLLQDKYGFKAEEFHAGEVNCIFRCNVAL